MVPLISMRFRFDLIARLDNYYAFELKGNLTGSTAWNTGEAGDIIIFHSHTKLIPRLSLHEVPIGLRLQAPQTSTRQSPSSSKTLIQRIKRWGYPQIQEDGHNKKNSRIFMPVKLFALACTKNSCYIRKKVIEKVGENITLHFICNGCHFLLKINLNLVLSFLKK